MDCSQLFHPGPLQDFLADQASAARDRRRGRTRSKAAASPREGDDPRRALAALVAQDRLFFRVVTAVAVRAGGRAEKERVAQLAGLGDQFRRTFVEVWERIPEADRQRLLGFWRDDRPRALPSDCRPGRTYSPVIHVFDSGLRSSARPAVAGAGHELNFVIPTAPDAWFASSVAHTLAEAYRHATGDHWRLVLQIVEGPMDAWERRQGKRLTEEGQARKHVQLDEEFVRENDREVARVLAHWGFEPPPSGNGPGTEPWEHIGG